jgi:hypothetical protein
MGLSYALPTGVDIHDVAEQVGVRRACDTDREPLPLTSRANVRFGEI